MYFLLKAKMLKGERKCRFTQVFNACIFFYKIANKRSACVTSNTVLFTPLFVSNNCKAKAFSKCLNACKVFK